MAGRKRRRRRNRRARLVLKLIRTVTVAVLLMGIAALGIWLLLDSRPIPTVTTYIMEYEDLIRQNAQENEIPPAYVAAIVLAESSYRPDAVSSVNAQGLMQILPSTGEWIAGKFDETYTEGCLFDPEINVRYGC